MVRLLGALVLLAAMGASALASPCGAPVGQPVVLKSVGLDPDVFVWDAKQRVVEYAGGYWRDTHDVLSHTMLAKPGTRAVVVQCEPGSVHVKYAAEPRDAVGIRLINGLNKGRYGWVTSDDVHLLEGR